VILLIHWNNFFKIWIDSFTKNYLKFDGRCSRLEFNLSTLFLCIMAVNVYYLSKIKSTDNSLMVIYLISGFFFMYLFINDFAVTTRRLHDLNLNGFLQFIIYFIPCGQLLMLWLIFKKGTSGDNKYGEEPKY